MELIYETQVFLTRPDALICEHEPFGDAFYYGPERLSERYENNEKARSDSGFSDSTYKTIVDKLDKDGAEVRSFLPSYLMSYSLYLVLCAYIQL